MEMEMMQVETVTMSAFACHVTAPRLTAAPCQLWHFFFTTRSSGDGDEPIILIYARPRATSRIGQWPGVDLALVMAVTTLILG
jgi:hypothetical protein